MNDSTAQSQESSQDLPQLLAGWKLKHLLPHLQAENINLEVLQMMKLQHIPLIMHGFPLGDQIRFEFNVEKWRLACGRPVSTQWDSSKYKPTVIITAAAPPQTSMLVASVAADATEAHVASASQALSFDFDREHVARSPLLAPPFGKYPQRRIHLRQILNISPRANQLLAYYGRNGCLQPNQRTALINLVAMYFFENDIHLTKQMAHKLESEILEMFPSEDLKDYYTGERSRIYKRVANIKHYNRKNKRNKDTSERPALIGVQQEDESMRELTDDEIQLSRDGYDQEEQEQEQDQSKEGYTFIDVDIVKKELKYDDDNYMPMNGEARAERPSKNEISFK